MPSDPCGRLCARRMPFAESRIATAQPSAAAAAGRSSSTGTVGASPCSSSNDSLQGEPELAEPQLDQDAAGPHPLERQVGFPSRCDENTKMIRKVSEEDAERRIDRRRPRCPGSRRAPRRTAGDCTSCNSLSRWRTAVPERRPREQEIPPRRGTHAEQPLRRVGHGDPERSWPAQAHVARQPCHRSADLGRPFGQQRRLARAGWSMSNVVTGTSSSSTSTSAGGGRGGAAAAAAGRRRRGPVHRANDLQRSGEARPARRRSGDPGRPGASQSSPWLRGLVDIPTFDEPQARTAPSSLRTRPPGPFLSVSLPPGRSHPTRERVVCHHRRVRAIRSWSTQLPRAVDARCRRRVDPAARGSTHEAGRTAHRPRTTRRPGRARRPRVAIVALLHDVIEKTDITPSRCAMATRGSPTPSRR